MLLHDCMPRLMQFCASTNFQKWLAIRNVNKSPTIPLYSNIKRPEYFFNEKETIKIVKITKHSHDYKTYASSYNVEILIFFNPGQDLKNTESVTENKLRDLLSEMRKSKVVTTLIRELEKNRK